MSDIVPPNSWHMLQLLQCSPSRFLRETTVKAHHIVQNMAMHLEFNKPKREHLFTSHSITHGTPLATHGFIFSFLCLTPLSL